jgi:hypothetical protein
LARQAEKERQQELARQEATSRRQRADHAQRLDSQEGKRIAQPAPSWLGTSPRKSSEQPLPGFLKTSGDGRRPASQADRRRWLVVSSLAVAAILVGAGIAGIGWRDTIPGDVISAPSAQKESLTVPPTQPGAKQTQSGDKQTQSVPKQPVATLAQRVVLYEEDAGDPQGKRFVGSAIWRTESVTSGPGTPSEIAVRADLDVPERRLTITFSLRRNTDKALPASHTIEMMFNVPTDFPFGGISNVPGILMKQVEQTRGVPLAGLAVKVTSNYFLIGLSAVDSDMQRNLQLLKERPWFDIPIVYNNGRRAILAIEKGTPGDRAFEQAFKAWGQ